MSENISLQAIPDVPRIEAGDNIGEVLATAIRTADMTLQECDVICVASKAVSVAEGRTVSLADITPSDIALAIHERIPRKDPRVIQAMLDETGRPDGSRLTVTGNHIGGQLPSGLQLTSAGIDKVDAEHIILLPEDPNASAQTIGTRLLEATGVQVAVVITDSDGRIDKKGATQVAIGCYGMPPLRTTTSAENGVARTSQETICDMMAAAAAIIMGQRGTNRPAVVIRGVDYTFDPAQTITPALNSPTN